MARDGSGNYSLPEAAFVAGTTIEADPVNNDFSDIAAALTASIAKDGQTTYTGNQPMGGFKLTGLGAGSGAGESVRYEEFKAAFRSHLAGLQMSSRTNTTISYTAGSWTESGQTLVFSNAAGTIDCATTGANGLDAGSLANSTWYHAYAIGKADLTTALLASTNASAPTMPSGYTLKRRIGSFKTNGSAQIISFIQDGDHFQWSLPVSDISANAPGTTAVTRTLASVPLGVRVLAEVTLSLANTNVSTSARAYLSDLSIDATVVTDDIGLTATAAGNVAAWHSRMSVFTDTSAQIRSQVSGLGSADVTLAITTRGWIDRRGKDL